MVTLGVVVDVSARRVDEAGRCPSQPCLDFSSKIVRGARDHYDHPVARTPIDARSFQLHHISPCASVCVCASLSPSKNCTLHFLLDFSNNAFGVITLVCTQSPASRDIVHSSLPHAYPLDTTGLLHSTERLEYTFPRPHC